MFETGVKSAVKYLNVLLFSTSVLFQLYFEQIYSIKLSAVIQHTLHTQSKYISNSSKAHTKAEVEQMI